MSLENHLPRGQTPPSGAGQPIYPGYPTYPGYPPYPTYPGYPAYGQYPYYGYAGGPQPTAPIVPMLPPVPSRAPDRPGRRALVGLVLTIVLAAATLGALALAAAAPALVARDPGPPPTGNGVTQVYNSSLRSDPTSWDTTNGCAFENGGLHATNEPSATLCHFAPSHQTDYTSGGFYLTTQIAPPGAVASVETACVAFSTSSNVITFAIDQYGAYALLTDPTDQCSTAPSELGQLQQDTAAWHGDGLVPNTLSVNYDAGSRILTVYVNGQQILQEGFLFGGQYDISLGTAAGDESIYTSFGLWSQSAG